jgi:hypothetical protein
MTPESRRIRANDAQQILDNKLFKDAWAAVDEYLNQSALTCSPDDQVKAQRIVISKQLLAALKREFVSHVQDGAIAQVQISELEQRRGLRKFLR